MKQSNLTILVIGLLGITCTAPVLAQDDFCDPLIETCDDYDQFDDDYCNSPEGQSDPYCYDLGSGEDDWCIIDPEICEDDPFDYGDSTEDEEFGDSDDIYECQAEVYSLQDLVEYLLSDGDTDDNGAIDNPDFDGTATSLPGTGNLGAITAEAKRQQAQRLTSANALADLKSKASDLNSLLLKRTEEQSVASQEAEKWQRKFKRLKRKSSGR